MSVEKHHIDLSVVIPVYQGAGLVESAVEETFAYLTARLPEINMEIIAVDDGSTDNSLEKLLALRGKYGKALRVIRFAKNFGSVAACHAGIDHARGDCVTYISQDLQDTPEMVETMFRSWRDEKIKLHIIVRTDERHESLLKKMPAKLYHCLIRWFAIPDYPANGLGVSLMDRQVADVLKKSRPRSAQIGAHVFSLGFNKKLHPFSRPPPKLKRSHWTFSKNVKLAIDTFTGFSYFPIRMMSVLGVVVAAGSFFFALYVLIGKWTDWYPISQPPGWATIIVLLTFCMGLVMVMLGIIGEYLWRTLDAVRNRPLYVVDEIHED